MAGITTATISISLAAGTASTPVSLNAYYRQIEVVNTTANAVWVTVDGSVPAVPANGVVVGNIYYVPPVIGDVTCIPLPYQEQQGVNLNPAGPLVVNATPVSVSAISETAGGVVVLAGYTIQTSI